jgi:hypothetical protein
MYIENKGYNALAICGTGFFILAAIFYILTSYSDPGFVEKKFEIIVITISN